MADYADLEISLRNGGPPDQFPLEMRLRLPRAAAPVEPSGDEALYANLDLDRLGVDAGDVETYSRALTDGLFAADKARKFFAAARAVATVQGVNLRVRLNIPRDLRALHNLRWELLRDPETDGFLAKGGDVFFSRYLSSEDWRSPDSRAREDLKALVVIAAPIMDEDTTFDPVMVGDEVRRARAALKDLPVRFLCRAGEPEVGELGTDLAGPPTLDKITQMLAEGYDILYLVCHGRLDAGGRPLLWLEDETGHAHRVPAVDEVDDEGRPRPGFVTRLSGLTQRPRLVALISCQSAGQGGEYASHDQGVLAALGPRLVAAGVPAVIAMQGDITMESAALFLPVFFRGLREKGQIDQAMSDARQELFGRQRADWWSPALFMRLDSGNIRWHDPKFEGSFTSWPGTVGWIKKGICTPVVGPGLLEFLCGTPRDIARRWAAEPGRWAGSVEENIRAYPIDGFRRESLPHVAQYLATKQLSPEFPMTQFQNYLKDEILRRHGELFPPGVRGAPEEVELDYIISEVGKHFREVDPADPYRVLARMPCSVYISATPDSLLTDALREFGRDPQIAVCPWNKQISSPLPGVKDDDFVPTLEQPLVYYLFGHLSCPESIVISEDHYFDFLVWASQNYQVKEDPVKTSVATAWATNSLLFVGFELDDWPFRVLLRGMTNPDGGVGLRQSVFSLAAQVSPGGATFPDPQAAQDYLVQYFGVFFSVLRLNVYWGTVHDFMRDIWKRQKDWLPKEWKQKGPADGTNAR